MTAEDRPVCESSVSGGGWATRPRRLELDLLVLVEVRRVGTQADLVLPRRRAVEPDAALRLLQYLVLLQDPHRVPDGMGTPAAASNWPQPSSDTRAEHQHICRKESQQYQSGAESWSETDTDTATRHANNTTFILYNSQVTSC